MSRLVTDLVRAFRLPATMKRSRPELKGVLLALADRCHDDGSNAYPSLETIALETEVSRKSAMRHLRAIAAAGLITEQLPPSQHRPRTWRINLAALVLTPEVPPTVTSDEESAVPPTVTSGDFRRDTTVSPLTAKPAATADDPEVTNGTSEVTNRAARGDTAVSPDPLNKYLNKEPSPQAAPSQLSREQRARNSSLMIRLAHEAYDSLGDDASEGDAVEQVKSLAAVRRIAYDSKSVADAVGQAQLRRALRRTQQPMGATA